jgi:hypothetical protein
MYGLINEFENTRRSFFISKNLCGTDQPQKRAHKSRTYVYMHSLLLKTTTLPAKKFKKRKEDILLERKKYSRVVDTSASVT